MNLLNQKLAENLFKLRLVENQISKKYSEQEIRCPVHLSIGQEAIAVGICQNLSLKDQVYSTHRCHSHYLAKGGNLKSMICELYGKQSGCCGGRGGSMHLMDVSVGMMLSLPIVASVIPIAVGAAMSHKMKKKKILLLFFLEMLQLKKEFFTSPQILLPYMIFQFFLYVKITDILVLLKLIRDNPQKI